MQYSQTLLKLSYMTVNEDAGAASKAASAGEVTPHVYGQHRVHIRVLCTDDETETRGWVRSPQSE